MVTAIGGNHHRIDYLIGPGRALDPSKYFIVATDAIGNGLSTSPSNSKAQPKMKFPKFNIRDMVSSQQKLLADKLGIKKVVTVVGASMGGMQALQWAVSYPDMMDSVVPIIPLGRTPAWTTGVLEMLRQSIMADPRWDNGNYAASAPPEQGMRLWSGWLTGVIVRTPAFQESSFPASQDVIASLKSIQDGGWRRMDAVDWIYQSWAYDKHDLGTTPGFEGNYHKALKSIKAEDADPRGHRRPPEPRVRGAGCGAVHPRRALRPDQRPAAARAPVRRGSDRARERVPERRDLELPRPRDRAGEEAQVATSARRPRPGSRAA